MTSILSHYARLRRQLAALEVDLGLDAFTPDEVGLISAIVDLESTTGPAQVHDLREHLLCRRLSKPTFYRALQRLVQRGAVRRIGSERSGLYVVNEAAIAPKG